MSCIRIITVLTLLCQCQFSLAIQFNSEYSTNYHPTKTLALFSGSGAVMELGGVIDFRSLLSQYNIISAGELLISVFTISGHSDDLIPESPQPGTPGSQPRFTELQPSLPASTPDSGIISDPNPLLPLNFDNPNQQAREFIEFLQPSHKYRLTNWTDINENPFTLIKRTLRELNEELQGEFSPNQMLLYHPSYAPQLIRDKQATEFSPEIHIISDDTLIYYLSIILGPGDKYLIIHESSGSITVKVLHNDGTLVTMTMRDILMKYGEIVYSYFERFFDLEGDSGTFYRPYHGSSLRSSSSQTVIIPHRKKKRDKIKGDPVPDQQPADGQGQSRSSSPKSGNTPPTTEKHHTYHYQTRLMVPASPDHDPGATPVKTTRRKHSKEAEPVLAGKTRKKPPLRFAIAKAITELSASEDKELRDRGIKELSQAVKKKHLKKYFAKEPGYPAGKPKEVKVEWLLDNGRAIDLARMVILKGSEETITHMSTPNILLKRHITRAQSIRRTMVKPQNTPPSHSPSLVNPLKTLLSKYFPGIESIQVVKVRSVDEAALEPLLKRNWQLIVSHSHKAPMFHSGDQKRIMTAAKTDNQAFTLVNASNRSLEYMMWIEKENEQELEEKEARRIAKIIAQVIPQPDLENTFKQALESDTRREGTIEQTLGLTPVIRLPNHPRAGSGRITLKPARKHIKVTLHEPEDQDAYVIIKTSIEFPGIIITTPAGATHEVPMTLAGQNVYKYILHSATAQHLADQHKIIVTEPPLPPMPSQATREQWERDFFENTKATFYSKLAAYQSQLEQLRAIPEGQEASFEAMTDNARKLKLAMQHLNLRYEEAREWEELPLKEVESIIQQIIKEMEKFRQRATPLLSNDSLYENAASGEALELIQGYRRYVLDAQAIYQQMLEIHQRRTALTEADLKKIEELTKQTEQVGDRARYSSHPLPALRKHLREREKDKLTDEQNTLTLHLQQLYFPMSSAFNALKAETLAHPAATAIEPYRQSLVVQEDEASEEEVDTPQPLDAEPELTMPFTMEDSVDDLEPEDNLINESGPSEPNRDSSESDIDD